MAGAGCRLVLAFATNELPQPMLVELIILWCLRGIGIHVFVKLAKAYAGNAGWRLVRIRTYNMYVRRMVSQEHLCVCVCSYGMVSLSVMDSAVPSVLLFLRAQGQLYLFRVPLSRFPVA